MRKYPYVPHPFVIDPPEQKGNLNPGDTLDFGLLLIGRGIEYLPYFICSFEVMTERGLGRKRTKFELKKVKQGRAIVYDCSRKALKRKVRETVLNLGKTRKSVGEVKISFKTPTRIIYKEKLAIDLEFHMLIRNLLRRISLLAYFHEDEVLDIDFKGLIDKAQKVRKSSSDLKLFRWERYSGRQKKKIPMDGVIGSLVFSGSLTEFLPYLEAGEIVHIGKGTAFGMGKYELGIKN